MIDKFKNIFEGLDRAHGVTIVGESNGNGTKVKGKSFVKREPVTDELWQKHLDGVDSLGVIPINDDNTKDEAYRVRVNSCEITINYDMYAFMEYIRNNYKDERFHFATLLRDLDINKVITKDYRGKPNDLFQSRKELLNILFENLKSPKGYWISRVQYWI